MNTQQAIDQAIEALEVAALAFGHPGRVQAMREAQEALRSIVIAPQKSPNELLLDEMLQNCLKINRELVQAIKEIQKTVNDEESAQAIARALLKNVGINQ